MPDSMGDSAETDFFCEDCGLDLTVDMAQVQELEGEDGPGLRCPRAGCDGLLELHAELPHEEER